MKTDIYVSKIIDNIGLNDSDIDAIKPYETGVFIPLNVLMRMEQGLKEKDEDFKELIKYIKKDVNDSLNSWFPEQLTPNMLDHDIKELLLRVEGLSSEDMFKEIWRYTQEVQEESKREYLEEIEAGIDDRVDQM